MIQRTFDPPRQRYSALSFKRRLGRDAFAAAGLCSIIVLGALLLSAGGNVQPEKTMRAVALASESIAVVQSPLADAQSAIVSCLDLVSPSPVSSSAAVVIPVAMDKSVPHEAAAVNRLDRIMFTVSATNKTGQGVRLTLVNRLVVNLICDVYFMQ